MSLHVKLLTAVLCAGMVAGCKAKADGSGSPPESTPAATAQQQTGDEAPPAEKMGGFDGKRAFAHVAKQVGFGPRPSGSAAIGQLQEYIQAELTSYGCKVDTDSFTAGTPGGRLPVKNNGAKSPGGKPPDRILPRHILHHPRQNVDPRVDVAAPP